MPFLDTFAGRQLQSHVVRLNSDGHSRWSDGRLSGRTRRTGVDPSCVNDPSSAQRTGRRQRLAKGALSEPVIDMIDGQLQAWITGIAPNTPVSFAAPTDMQADGGVNAYLFALADMPPSRNGKRAPLQFRLRYLLTTWSDDPQAAHRLLGELTLAAMEQPEWTVSLESLDPAFWAAMRVPPRPALVLDIPLRHERPEPPVKRVRAPLVMQSAPLMSLHGVLLGPDDIPLADARIEYAPLNQSTFTDTQGHFRLPIGPPGAGPQALRVLSKGRDFEVALDGEELAEEPLIIRVDFFRE